MRQERSFEVEISNRTFSQENRESILCGDIISRCLGVGLATTWLDLGNILRFGLNYEPCTIYLKLLLCFLLLPV